MSGNSREEKSTQSPETSPAPKLSTKALAVRKVLVDLNVSYDYHTSAFKLDKRPIEYPRLIDHLVLHPTLRKVSERKINAALSLWTSEQSQLVLDDAKAALMDIEVDRGRRELEKWVDAVIVDGHKLTHVVMLHWVWQIKRKLYGYPVTDPICPVLYGRTRGGKTTAVLQLTKPLNPLVNGLTIDQVQDDRYWRLLKDYYITIIDELAGAQKACIETLKYLITTPHVRQRVFHSQEKFNIFPQNTTFIGTSNKPVAIAIPDSTSGARYWELRCKDRLDWATLGKIDYGLLWASVDYNKASPLSGKWREQVQDLQHRKLRLQSPIEVWVDEIGLAPGKQWVGTTTIYANYCSWADRAGVNAASRIVFTKTFAGLGFRKSRHTANRARGFLVNSQDNFVSHA